MRFSVLIDGTVHHRVNDNILYAKQRAKLKQPRKKGNELTPIFALAIGGVCLNIFYTCFFSYLDKLICYLKISVCINLAVEIAHRDIDRGKACLCHHPNGIYKSVFFLQESLLYQKRSFFLLTQKANTSWALCFVVPSV